MTKTQTRFERLLATPRPWLADGGLETDLIFHGGFDLPLFAAFHLIESKAGRRALAAYFERFIGLAKQARTGFVLDTPTWRAGASWGARLGRSPAEMARINHRAAAFAWSIRAEHETAETPILVNGVVGPAGDGYSPDALLSPDAAEARHRPQVRALADAGAEAVSAITMTHTGEAIGIVRAVRATGLPVVVSFTVETDGRLPSGQSLGEAVAETDAATGSAPAYYMVNCAHPDHFSAEVAGDWTLRIGGVRANASRLSHAELDEAAELDDGNPEEFGALYGALAPRLANLRLIGGCCGTDDRHVGCAARHVVGHAVAAAA